MSTERVASELPRHVAIIMDGNGRWAQKRGLPRILGHRAGVKTVRRIVEECANRGIEALTLYAFSTENWLRPKGEIRGLMSILRTYLKGELDTMMKNGIRFRTIGDSGGLPPAVQRELKLVRTATANNTGMVLNLALNYGGRQEILRAVNRLIETGARQVDEKSLSGQLYTAGLPDPDLLIRTSGEMRISNFLLWQIAYTELYVTDVLWPDFSVSDLDAALAGYRKRERRFGAVSSLRPVR